MNAKFNVHFETVFSEDRPCQAQVRVSLASSQRARLDPEQINCHYDVVNQPLTDTWGRWDESGYRYAETTFSADDWDELTKRVQKFIADTRQTLLKVVTLNKNIIESKPTDYEAVYNIG